MSIRMMSAIPARVIQVLQDFLPAELDLIDAEEADGIVTPDIPTNPTCWHAWDRRLIVEFPAMSIRTAASSPLEVRPDTFGARVNAIHRLDLMFHATLANAGTSPLTLQKLMHRYVSGAVRVLAVMKEGLQTVGDPVRWGSPVELTLCEWVDDATYGPEVEQEGGAIVRTATLPVRIQRVEARS